MQILLKISDVLGDVIIASGMFITITWLVEEFISLIQSAGREKDEKTTASDKAP